MSKHQIIVADDGSTSVKLAWFEDKELKTLTVSNSAEYGRGFTEDGGRNYTVETANGEQTFCFLENAESVRSKNEGYQYDAHSVAAIHYALHRAGFQDEMITLAVTLPLSQFYKGKEKNEENIERKKQSVLRAVHSDSNLKGNVIREVMVFPEGIPACYPNLVGPRGRALVDDEELTFLADMGGTTLDLCLFSGAAKERLKAESHSAGMFDTFDQIMIESNLPKRRDLILKKLLETGKASGGRFTVDRKKATDPVMARAKNLIIDFLGDDLHLLSNCFCIGGGAELLADKLREIEGLEPQVIENPVEALASAIATIANK